MGALCQSLMFLSNHLCTRTHPHRIIKEVRYVSKIDVRHNAFVDTTTILSTSLAQYIKKHMLQPSFQPSCTTKLSFEIQTLYLHISKLWIFTLCPQMYKSHKGQHPKPHLKC